MGRKIDIGKIAITPEGEWLADRNYEYLSFVQHNGSGYLSLQDNENVEPGTDENVWMLASKGGTPELTSDEDGNIYADGKLLSSTIAEAKALNDRIASEEQERANAEQTRVASENIRIESEGQRINAETARKSAESSRVSNEESRKRFETQRLSAETERRLAENNRVENEAARLSAENQRISAERARVTNENARIVNERNRQDAEAARAVALANKQDKLISGENIKTLNGKSLLGKGNIDIGDEGAVRFVSQNLTNEQKAQARTNIEAYKKPASGIPASDIASDVIQDISNKQDAIPDLSAIRSGAALGKTSVQPVDIENMVEAEPIGSIIPPVNPSEFATKVELSQLSQELYGVPAHTISHDIAETIERGNHENYAQFTCLAGISYQLDATLDQPTSTGTTNIKLYADGEQVARLDIVSPATGINSASQGQVLQFNEDTVVDLDIWLPGDYYSTRLVTVFFIETVAKTDGDIDTINDAISELDGKIGGLTEDMEETNERTNGNDYKIKSIEVAEPYWTGKVFSGQGTKEGKFVKLKAGYHYTFVSHIQSAHSAQVYCQIRTVLGDEGSLVASLNIPVGDTNSAARYITTNGIDFSLANTYDVGYNDKDVFLYVYCSASIDVYLDIYAKKTDGETISHNRIVSPDIFESKTVFCARMNTVFSNYVISTGMCNKVCMSILRDTESWTDLFEKVNHNFRRDVVSANYSISGNCDRINKALEEKIFRFVDACKNNTENYNGTSINTGINGDEPSAIISEDGDFLYIYARKYRDYHFRFKTADGIRWEEDRVYLTGGENQYLFHPNVSYIDGVYYLIGATANSAGNLVLYTSSDGINFTYVGVIFNAGHSPSQYLDVTNWGNVTLYKEPRENKWYLYYEIQDTNVPGEGWHGWEICLAVCNNILAPNQDGTVGDWVDSNNNPIFPYIKSINKSCGNPDFAKGCDNMPIRVDGKYFIYFHGHFDDYDDDTPGRSDIFRAYSTDLQNWTQEGMIFDNRDDPTRGVGAPGNADHCIIEWHNKTYLFYSWNINDPNNSPYLKMMVDDRPLHELLRMRP